MLKYLTSLIGRIVIYSAFVAFLVFQINKTKNDEIVSNKTYPIEATKYVKEHIDINKMKLFNEYNFGSYLLYQDVPVFIDSRADVYDPAFNGWEDDIFNDFLNISDANNYEEKFNHYGITHLLIYKNSVLGKVLRKDTKYKELFSDSNFVIYERLNK